MEGSGGYEVLVVDDDDGVAGLLARLAAADGHAVRRARDGREALDRVAERSPDLILLDLDMPRLGGFDVCAALKADPRTRLVPVVIVTGQSAAEARLRAWELGADDFLTKPFDRAEVSARCRALLRVKALVDELDSAEAVVFALARTLEAKSRYTRGHSDRVTWYAVALAARVGLPAGEREAVRRGAMLHDIGKIAVPDAILDKPGRLTAAEYEVVKRHPADGARILEPLRSVRDALPLVRWHHERVDGRGYPDGLAGAAIPLAARILAVADVYDAVASVRPYRPAIAQAECLRLLSESAAGGGLDPDLVRHFSSDPAVPDGVPPPSGSSMRDNVASETYGGQPAAGKWPGAT